MNRTFAAGAALGAPLYDDNHRSTMKGNTKSLFNLPLEGKGDRAAVDEVELRQRAKDVFRLAAVTSSVGFAASFPSQEKLNPLGFKFIVFIVTAFHIC